MAWVLYGVKVLHCLLKGVIGKVNWVIAVDVVTDGFQVKDVIQFNLY